MLRNKPKHVESIKPRTVNVEEIVPEVSDQMPRAISLRESSDDAAASVKDAIFRHADQEWISCSQLDMALDDLRIVLPKRARDNLQKLIHVDHGGQLNAHEAVMYVEAIRTHMLRDAAHRDTHMLANNVFLGGSCSPTTWRHDIIIPMLEKANITYYNPQVDDWKPELVHQEAVAKKLARVLLFVVDHQTRALASLIEIMELMLMGRALVLVIRPIPTDAVITGKSIQNEERLELNRCREFLRNMARDRGIRVFDDIAEGGRYLMTVCTDPETSDTPICIPKQTGPLKPFVYLGGVRSRECSWRHMVAKTLSRARVAYHNPAESETVDADQRALNDSSVILYVIDGEARGVRAMLESVRMVVPLSGKKCFIVINDIPRENNKAKIVEKAELKDYNRARAYLADCMSRHGFVVYRDLDLAVHYIINAVNNREMATRVTSFEDDVLTSLDHARENMQHVFRRKHSERKQERSCSIL